MQRITEIIKHKINTMITIIGTLIGALVGLSIAYYGQVRNLKKVEKLKDDVVKLYELLAQKYRNNMLAGHVRSLNININPKHMLVIKPFRDGYAAYFNEDLLPQQSKVEIISDANDLTKVVVTFIVSNSKDSEVVIIGTHD
jgi:hypothetical protein